MKQATSSVDEPSSVHNSHLSITPSMASEVAEHKYQLNVKMTCGGCSGAVTRVLTKAQQEGSVSSFDVDLGTQLVNVTGPIEEAALVEKIQKTGKQIISVTSLDDSVAEVAAV